MTDTVIDAQLQLPMYSSWNGIATGSLDVVNKTKGIYREYSVTNNPDVRGNITYASRNPDIHTRIYREDLGDDPINRDFADSDPIQNQGKVSYSGGISRPYTYAYPVGKTVITGESTAVANFDSGTHINTITANVYNGMKSITKKRFDDIIKNNINGALKKELYWTSEEYSLDVVRLMYHMDEDDSLYDETVVGGQYKRQFTQQCSGTVEWEYVSPMSQEYMRSRKAAKDRSYDSDDYDRAVFATDKDMRNEDYPIKSGYFFNPAGEYKFTVETVTYKPKKGNTQDHKDLVDTVIKSFRYETDLMYINNSKDAVNIQNEYLQKTPNGNSYRKKPAVLTADDPDGVNGIKLLQVIRGTTDINEKRLEHSQQANGYTHEYFKNILEGYSESGTKSSDTSYKYREYIKDGQEIYKITERTEVTIKVNPNNAKVYTHAHMPDGKYYIKVWVDEIDLSGMASAYNKLDILEGISQLDEIKVTVKGSMYDDIN